MKVRKAGVWLSVTALLLAGIAGGVVNGSGGATTANLWAVHSGGACSARSATAVTLSNAPSSAKCNTWAAAYLKAQNGDTVGIETGASYGSQNFTSCNTGLSGTDHLAPNGTEVTFKPDTGTVTADLQGFAGCRYNVAFRNVVGCGDFGNAGAHDIHLVGFDCANSTMFIGNNASFISIQGSDFGPLLVTCGATSKLLMFWGANNILLEGSTFHDLSATEGCGTHPDAIEACGAPCGISTVHDVTIRGNRYWNNACDSGRYQDPTDHHFLIENNMYGPAVTFEGGCGQSLAARGPAFVVRNNTFDAPVDSSSSQSDAIWDGNIFLVGQSGSDYDCISGIASMKGNVGLTGSPTTCGTGQPNTVVANMTGWFTDPSVGNFHLTSCALGANNAGNPLNFPTIDFDGGTRSNPPDAGADECGAP